MGKTIPDRWLPYTNIGQVIPGTRFFAFKVPLREEALRRCGVPDPQWHTIDSLAEAMPGLELVLDITNTDRYYDPQDFRARGVQHEKILCPGHEVPPKRVLDRFSQVVDKYLAEHADGEGLIGVHCTHGLNRTGYLICKYLITKQDWEPDNAIHEFNQARGHNMERENYLCDLKGVPYTGPPVKKSFGWQHAGPRQQPRQQPHHHKGAKPSTGFQKARKLKLKEQQQQEQQQEEQQEQRPQHGSWRSEGPARGRGGPRGHHGGHHHAEGRHAGNPAGYHGDGHQGGYGGGYRGGYGGGGYGGGGYGGGGYGGGGYRGGYGGGHQQGGYGGGHQQGGYGGGYKTGWNVPDDGSSRGGRRHQGAAPYGLRQRGPQAEGGQHAGGPGPIRPRGRGRGRPHHQTEGAGAGW